MMPRRLHPFTLLLLLVPALTTESLAAQNASEAEPPPRAPVTGWVNPEPGALLDTAPPPTIPAAPVPTPAVPAPVPPTPPPPVASAVTPVPPPTPAVPVPTPPVASAVTPTSPESPTPPEPPPLALQPDPDPPPRAYAPPPILQESLGAPTRHISAALNQQVEVVLPGLGWVYLGERASSPLLSYERREQTGTGAADSSYRTVFTLHTQNPGRTLAQFYKRDPLSTGPRNELVDFTVAE